MGSPSGATGAHPISEPVNPLHGARSASTVTGIRSPARGTLWSQNPHGYSTYQVRTCVRDVPGHRLLAVQACARAAALHAGLDDGRRTPQGALADGLELLLLARDLEPARFDRAVPRWHARLCSEQRLSSGEAQLALATLNALPGPGVQSAVRSLAAVCETHGLGREVRVLQSWLAARATAP